MAKKLTDSQKLVTFLLSGKIESTMHLRKILNKGSINYLTLLDKEIALMVDFIDSGKAGNNGAKIKEAITSGTPHTVLSSNYPLETGVIVTEDATYNEIKNLYITTLNAAVGDGEKYELGHETGVLTRILQIINEGYKPTDTYAKTRKALLEKAVKTSLIIDRIDRDFITKLHLEGASTKGLKGTDFIKVLESAGKAMTLDVYLEKDIANSIGNLSLKIGLRAELTTQNQFTGGLAKSLQGIAKQILTTNKESDFAKIDKILANTDVFNMRGSPSIIDVINANLDSAFGKPNSKKPENLITKSRVSRKIPANNTALISLRQAVKKRVSLLKTKLRAVKNKKKFVMPTVSLKAILNQSLASFIQLRMKHSSAPASISYLRNQTGRLSESARILTLNRTETGAYFGTYTYMHEPYQIFEPSEKLGSPGRDPRLYIEGAAREIAIEVLKKQFVGIQLESK